MEAGGGDSFQWPWMLRDHVVISYLDVFERGCGADRFFGSVKCTSMAYGFSSSSARYSALKSLPDNANSALATST